MCKRPKLIHFLLIIVFVAVADGDELIPANHPDYSTWKKDADARIIHYITANASYEEIEGLYGRIDNSRVRRAVEHVLRDEVGVASGSPYFDTIVDSLYLIAEGKVNGRVSSISPYISFDDPRVKKNAIEATAQTGGEQAWQVLADALGDEDILKASFSNERDLGKTLEIFSLLSISLAEIDANKSMPVIKSSLRRLGKIYALSPLSDKEYLSNYEKVLLAHLESELSDSNDSPLTTTMVSQEKADEPKQVIEVIDEVAAPEPAMERNNEVVSLEPSEEPVEKPSNWWLWLIGAVVVVGGLAVVFRRKS